MVETIFAEAYQGPISFAEDAALVDEYILCDRASLIRGNESIPLLVGEPTDRIKKALKLVDTHARKDLARKNLNWFRNRSSPQQHLNVAYHPLQRPHHLQVPRSFWSDMVGAVETALKIVVLLKTLRLSSPESPGFWLRPALAVWPPAACAPARCRRHQSTLVTKRDSSPTTRKIGLRLGGESPDELFHRHPNRTRRGGTGLRGRESAEKVQARLVCS